ncbi:MerR family transcriptional regulator [Microtetraspora sp. NBRC 13810]|uniref:MerR family transcriptional regulator n=1 Tax=Microtetraspora sp. NBRC 13810 TaxID=3030990 RepID=UPI0024A1527F|nr:MerR family transcriptional regulator [Microtetraspora sp. NBRC 13810]GLW08087.1 MerR family transcriptional regulator [Microtetraspora sp. NBRC 13810]
MRIGALAERVGVSTRALRYYEEKGLLIPGRTPAGYRVYTDEHAATVRRIRILLAAGLNTDLVREILPCMVDDGEFLAPGCVDLVAEFERERRRIDDRIAELHDVRSALTGIIEAGLATSAGR